MWMIPNWYVLAFLGFIAMRTTVEAIIIPSNAAKTPGQRKGVPSFLILVLTYLVSAIVVVYFLWEAQGISQHLVIAGLLVVAAGYGGRIYSLRAIHGSYSLFIEPRDGDLVTTGIYGIIRHPLYLFYSIELAGLCLICPNPISFVALILNVWTCLHRANKEELCLEEKFGERFHEYKRRTNKFIPFIF
jgi:protein-S-isoprenylcysteine O-methyltransferase Ste14